MTDSLPTEAELEARHAAVRAAMAERSLDWLLVYGNLASAHPIRWLTRWPPGWDSYLVFPIAGMPRLLVPSENHLPTAEGLAGPAVEAAYVGFDACSAIRTALKAKGGRIGLIGPLPYGLHRCLSEAGVELVEADSLYRALRMVKRPEDIERTREAAAIADAAVGRLLDEMRPGLRDYQLGAILQGACRDAGGEDGICFLASAPMDGGGAVVPAQVLSHRALQQGDLVMFELSVGVAGDTSQVLRTITLGPATDRVRRLHDVADETFEAIRKRLRPGVTPKDLLECGATIDEAGLTVVDDVVHGYGGGYLPPVLRTPATQRRPPPDLVFEPGMMVVIQPNVVDRDRSLGIQTGELVVVTDDGTAPFHALPRGILER
jgi:Xaa-Pro dipeptidase